MPAGTLTLTNNSAVVKGTGTAFNTELKTGDFIVSTVGGVTYTLPVKTVDSATQATLVKAYDGPTQTGAAWYAVPRDAMNTITAQLAAETAKALRGLNLDKENWQQVFSNTGNITVKLPDGSTYSGPAWNSFISQLNLKANKTDLGNSAWRNVGNSAGTVAAGDDRRLNTVDGKSGGKLSHGMGVAGAIGPETQGTYLSWNESGSQGEGAIIVNSGEGVGGLRVRIVNGSNTANKAIFDFYSDGTFQATGGVYSVGGRVRAFTAVAPNYVEIKVDGIQRGINFFDSDERLKENVEDVARGKALSIIKRIRPVSYKFKDTEFIEGARHQFGVIAQELEKILPEAVITLSNGNKALDPLELLGLLLTSNKEMLDRIDRQDKLIKEFMGKVQ